MTPELIAIMERQGGVFLRAQALAAGMSEDEVRRHVSRQAWIRVCRGAYTIPEIWAAAGAAERHVLAFRAAALRLDPPVVGSHQTAAAVHGIELLDPAYEWINVTRPDRSARREVGVWHHMASLGPADVVSVRGLSVTSLERTGLDVARYAVSREHAVVAVDSALRRGEGSYEDRAQRLERMRDMQAACSDWPGARISGGSVALADARCGSVGETLTRLLLTSYGSPRC